MSILRPHSWFAFAAETLSFLIVVGSVRSTRAERDEVSPQSLATDSGTSELHEPEPAELERGDAVREWLEPYALRAIELRWAGRTEEALRTLEQAYRKHPHVRLLARIALAEAELGLWVRAYTHMRVSLQVADAWIDENRTALNDVLTRSSNRVALVTLQVSPPHGRVVVAGVERKSSPIAVEPGAVRIDISAPAYRDHTMWIAVEAGSSQTQVVELVAVPAAAPAARAVPPTPLSSGTRNPVWLWIGGTGAAVALASLAPWLIADAQVRNMQRDCIEGCVNFESRRDAVEQLDMATNALLITGGLTLVGAASAYFIDIIAKHPVTINAQLGAGVWGISHRTRF